MRERRQKKNSEINLLNLAQRLGFMVFYFGFIQWLTARPSSMYSNEYVYGCTNVCSLLNQLLFNMLILAFNNFYL